MRVGVEEDMKAPGPLAVALAIMAAVAAFYVSGICMAVFLFYLLLFVEFFWHTSQSVRRLPANAVRAAQRALEFYRERYPEDPPKQLAVRAIEPERYIISVRYGMGRPGPRRYFAVPRDGDGEITELPCSDWWPRGVK